MTPMLESLETIAGKTRKVVRVIKLKFRRTAVYYAIYNEKGFNRGVAKWYRNRPQWCGFCKPYFPPFDVMIELCKEYGKRIRKDVLENKAKKPRLGVNDSSYDLDISPRGAWEEFVVEI